MCSTILVLTVLLTPVKADAPKVELLWPGGAPDAKGTEAADKPTLTVFTLAEGKANGTAVVVCPGGGYTFLADDHKANRSASGMLSAA